MDISSGCIVVKKFNGEPHILMVHAAGNWKNKNFGFPKGIIEENENTSAAAARETEEETGVIVDIIGYLGSVHRNVKGLPHKEVHAYIALYKDGNLEGKNVLDFQKSEIDVAKFYPVDQAVEIAYGYQKPLLEKAKEFIKKEL